MYKKLMLDYDYNSMEPVIDGETMYIHYNRYYLGYLNELNYLLEGSNYKYTKRELANMIDSYPMDKRGDILYNLGGVVNHEIYFNSISDKGNIYPSGKLKEDIDVYFGSYDNFKSEFKRSANSLKGSGYTFLVKDKNDRLLIINTSNQDTPYYYGFVPIMGLDLWEHAYYLHYKDNRRLYIDNFFKIVDFNKIGAWYDNEKRTRF